MTRQSSGTLIHDRGSNEDELLDRGRERLVISPQCLTKGLVVIGGAVHLSKRVAQGRTREFRSTFHSRPSITEVGTAASLPAYAFASANMRRRALADTLAPQLTATMVDPGLLAACCVAAAIATPAAPSTSW